MDSPLLEEDLVNNGDILLFQELFGDNPLLVILFDELAEVFVVAMVVAAWVAVDTVKDINSAVLEQNVLNMIKT